MKDDIREIVEDYTERTFSRVADRLRLNSGDTSPEELQDIEEMQRKWTEILYRWACKQDKREEETDIPF